MEEARPDEGKPRQNSDEEGGGACCLQEPRLDW